jgi:hypothetical protein
VNPPEQARQYAVEDVVCYHEAGHAVAFWHYGVELRYVSARPTADGAHRGQTVTVDRAPPAGVAELETEMKCAAAGDIAQKRLFPDHRLPADGELTRGFEVLPARLNSEPELAVEDTADFVRFGRDRDDEIRSAGADAPTGPAGWLRIWREAEQLIRVELWPAVEAVAEELRRSEHLGGADVAALAKAAMGGHPR